MLTNIERFGIFHVKREDKAGWVSLDLPSGSKVRQYNAMAKPGIPMIVGCASNSAMQIYVAASSMVAQVPGIIYVPRTKEFTDATRYALEMGAEINEVYPGYMNVVRSRAKARAIELGKVVRWDVRGAIEDAAKQVANIPECKRIVVPTGSGLTATGIIVGLVRLGRNIPLLLVAVSNLANEGNIKGLAKKHLGSIGGLTEPELPSVELVRSKGGYNKPLIRRLPDGTPLDPFYAAKAIDQVLEGDCLWVPGLRPVRSMPESCRCEFASWKGFA